jgi:hypothetical protein
MKTPVRAAGRGPGRRCFEKAEMLSETGHDLEALVSQEK